MLPGRGLTGGRGFGRVTCPRFFRVFLNLTSPNSKKLFMKPYRLAVLIGLLSTVVGTGIAVRAQGTAFTYQGRLNDTNGPANGSYDGRFTLYSGATNGSAVVAGPVTNAAVTVSNGLFTTTIDFGNVFNGDPRWLEIGVQTSGGTNFVTLTPRQPVTPTPYAITAGNVTGVVANGSVAGSYDSQVTFDNGGNQFTGAFSGDGSLLNNVNAVTLNGLGPAFFWQTSGNYGTSPQNGNFIGTLDNQAFEIWVNDERGFRVEPPSSGIISTVVPKGKSGPVPKFGSSSVPNIIGGGSANSVYTGSQGSVIAGGGSTSPFSANTIGADFGFIGGGQENFIQSGAENGAIGGGLNNVIQSGEYGFIGGGSGNSVQSDGTSPDFIASAAIAGGNNNIVNTDDGFIGGGLNNSIQGSSTGSTIAGGNGNGIQGGSANSSIAGGQGNIIQDNAADSFIGGGSTNQVQSHSTGAVMRRRFAKRDHFHLQRFLHVWCGKCGDRWREPERDTGVSQLLGTIGGGSQNLIQSNSFGAVIAGGQGNQISRVYDYNTVISGGFSNQIQNPVQYASIVGGEFNSIQGDASLAFIGGGYSNSVQYDAYESVIGGGGGNQIQFGSFGSLIGAGDGNTIAILVGDAVIAGGSGNAIQNYSTAAAIGGGAGNTILADSTGTGDVSASVIAGGNGNSVNTDDAFIGGGSSNQVLSLATGSVIAGGSSNMINGPYAMIPGGLGNAATNNAFAAGSHAKAVNAGSFVWADSQAADFSSTVDNQAAFRCAGGVIFASGGSSVSWTPGSGSWVVSTSDRNAKENFQPIDAQSVLEKVAQLPLTEWNYKGYGDRHVGPMAQDFHTAFPFNGNDKMLNSADEAGITLAAIQGLNQKLETEVKQKDEKIGELEKRLDDLEQMVQTMAAKH